MAALTDGPMNLSFSTEVEPEKIELEMHHMKPSVLNPIAEIAPDPELSPHANFDVISGKRGGPAVDPNIIENQPTICVVCGVDFKIRANLHVHLTEHIHLPGKLDNYLKIPVYECKHCLAEVNGSNLLKHRCFIKHQADVIKAEHDMDELGSPLVCIFCRGRVLPSRAHLIAHLISAHSPHRNPFRCIFCHSLFQSDCLTMQETHVFDHHVPELIMLNRLAYFKAAKTTQGGNIDPTLPFLCLYDGRKVEQAKWWEGLKPSCKNTIATANQGGDNDSSTHEVTSNVSTPGFCSTIFQNLAEMTAHLYCQHTVVAQGSDLTGLDLGEEELKRLEKRQKRLPGPTIRQMMNGPPSGASTSESKHHKLSKKTKNAILKSTCRVCLQNYEDENSLKAHHTAYHIPESTKRVQHLVATGELTHVLKIDLLCTECYTIFRSAYKLQVHIMVAHGGKNWCSCGICDQEFCESDKTLPSILTVGKVESKEEENQNSNPDNPSADVAFDNIREPGSTINSNFQPYTATLPTLTLCRILETHEERHCKELRPPKSGLFLPIKLLQQILNSRGQQAAQVAAWIMEAFYQPAHIDVKPFKYEDPNDKKKNKRGPQLEPGKNPLSEEELVLAVETMRGLFDRTNKSLTTAGGGCGAGTRMGTGGFGLESAHSSPSGHSAPSTDVNSAGGRGAGLSTEQANKEYAKLPHKLTKQFAQIGEKNAATQAELEFAETL